MSILDKVDAIISGWRNHLIPPADMKELILKVSEERLAICRPCEFNSKNKKENPEGKVGACTQCHCPLVMKSKALNHACPIGKWGAIITDDERKTLDNQLTELKDAKDKL